MTPELILIGFAIILLLLISAFFSGSETALTAVSRARMHKLEKDGNQKATIVNALINTKERLIGTILLGNNLVNILASALTTSLFMNLFGAAGVIYATIIMTAFVVVFAEVLPKTYAITYPDKTALKVAPVFGPLITLFGPISLLVEKIVEKILMRFIGISTEQLDAHEELRGAIDLHHREGAVVKHDKDMLGGILDLKALDIEDVMIHRTKMAALNADDNPRRLVDEALKSSFTRLPLWRDEPENIIGILHVKDLVRAYSRCDGDVEKIDIAELTIDPWFVPETTSLKDQLAAFLRKKQHFALVVDEYGEVQGLLTLEDILEEIVGDILDEHDTANTGIRPQPNGSVNVDGPVTIRDLNRQFDWNLPDVDATTIAGLVIHNAQAIPEPGQRFTFHNFMFEVLRRKRNQITALRITPQRKLG
ncbi:MAG: HlyC/CorC family transporter [bacterium]|nr:HlyC/CorC family transporter [bacterium]